MALRPSPAPRSDGPFAAPARVFLAAALALTLAACGQGKGPAGKSGGEVLRGSDPVVAAMVNGKPVYVTDVFVEATRRGVIAPGEDLDASTDEFYQILQDLVETRLLAQEAEARGLDKNAEARHRLEAARTVVLAGLLDEHLRDTLVSEADLRRFYKENARLLGAGELVHARHIQLASRDAAVAAKARLDRGEPFETVAFEASQDRVTGGEGGDLGFRAPENFPEGLQEAIRTTAVGGVAGPVQTELGWHLVKIEERRRRDPPSFEAMRPRLVEQLYWEELRRVIERLRAEARIELFIDERNTGVGPRPGLQAPDSAEPRAPARRAAPADEPAPVDGPQAAAPQEGAPPVLAPAPPAGGQSAQASSIPRTPSAQAAPAARTPAPTARAPSPQRPASSTSPLPPGYKPGDVIITPEGENGRP